MSRAVNKSLTLRDTVAANVRRLMRTKRVSVTTLSKRMHCSRQYVYLIKAGLGNVTLETLEQLSRGLKVLPAELCKRPRGKDRVKPDLPPYLRALEKNAEEAQDALTVY